MMNFSLFVEDWIKDPITEYLAEEGHQGGFLALLEMILAITGTVLNLVVFIPIISSSLMNSTLNLLIANLCLANLVSAVFVKLIGVIYHGYAVAAARYDIQDFSITGMAAVDYELNIVLRIYPCYHVVVLYFRIESTLYENVFDTKSTSRL